MKISVESLVSLLFVGIVGVVAGAFFAFKPVTLGSLRGCLEDPMAAAISQTEGYLNAYTKEELVGLLQESGLSMDDMAKYKVALDYATMVPDPTMTYITGCLNK